MRRHLIVAGAVSAALALGGCSGLESFVKAANELDPDCAKEVHAKFATVFVFGAPVPILTEGSYTKKCSEKQSGPSTPVVNGQPLLGAVIPVAPSQ